MRVTYLSGGMLHTETADRLICTIPFTVLRDIEVSPTWSAGKDRAIRDLYMGRVARVFVQTRTRFWEQQKLTGFATVDQPMEIWNPTFNQPGTRGILMSYIYERLARGVFRADAAGADRPHARTVRADSSGTARERRRRRRRGHG